MNPHPKPRPKTDPNDLNPFTITEKVKRARPASERKKKDGGKIKLSINIPPYLYELIREEAIVNNRSMQREAILWLEAAADHFEEKKECKK